MPKNALVLVINPNSSESITEGLRAALSSICPDWLDIEYYTAPKHAPEAIVDYTTMVTTATYCYDDLKQRGALDTYDGFLVCCCKSSNSRQCQLVVHHTDCASDANKNDFLMDACTYL